MNEIVLTLRRKDLSRSSAKLKVLNVTMVPMLLYGCEAKSFKKAVIEDLGHTCTCR